MYKIAVCDDERECLEDIVSLTRSVMDEISIGYSVEAFRTRGELLESIDAGREFDLLLLDILLADGNGIDLARELRGRGVKSSLIFISACADFVLDGYEVEAIQYLLKPVKRDRLKAAVVRDCRRLEGERNLCCWQGGTLLYIRQSDLVYMESCRRQVYLHLRDGRCECVRAKLADLEARLSELRFSRCHVSFCVNLDYVIKSGCSSVELSTGESLPVGRTYKKRFQRKMLRYFSL